MKFLNAAIILTAAAISASASAVANSKFMDSTAPLKVKESVLSGQNFFKVVSVCNKGKPKDYNNEACKAGFENLQNNIKAGEAKALKEIKSEQDVINDIISTLLSIETDENKRKALESKIKDRVTEALNSEKQDWAAAKSSMELMKDYLNGLNGVNSGISRIKSQYDGFADLLSQVLSGKGLGDLIQDPISYENYRLVFKKMVIATKMFSNPNDKTMNRYIFKDLDTYIGKLNDPENRFLAEPIEPTLNLNYIMTADASKSVQQAIAILKRNFGIFKAKSQSDEWKKDMELRGIVINILFKDPIADIESVHTRMRAFERVAEGVIRSILEGGDKVIGEPLASQVIKAWIMAKQMSETDGWRDINVKPGVLTLPAGVTLDLSGKSPVANSNVDNSPANSNVDNSPADSNVNNSLALPETSVTKSQSGVNNKDNITNVNNTLTSKAVKDSASTQLNSFSSRLKNMFNSK